MGPRLREDGMVEESGGAEHLNAEFDKRATNSYQPD